MKMKMIKHYSLLDRSILISIALFIYQERGKAPCLTHNHTLDFMDIIKINSFVMGIAGE